MGVPMVRPAGSIADGEGYGFGPCHYHIAVYFGGDGIGRGYADEDNDAICEYRIYRYDPEP